jgi:hypothetical protein
MFPLPVDFLSLLGEFLLGNIQILLIIAVCVSFVMVIFVNILKIDKSRFFENLGSAYSIIIRVAIVNFLLFIVISLLIGGDAINGKVEAGRYYLGNHGVYTEVNAVVFYYSKIHCLCVWITHPLAILAAASTFSTALTKLVIQKGLDLFNKL